MVPVTHKWKRELGHFTPTRCFFLIAERKGEKIQECQRGAVLVTNLVLSFLPCTSRVHAWLIALFRVSYPLSYLSWHSPWFPILKSPNVRLIWKMKRRGFCLLALLRNSCQQLWNSESAPNPTISLTSFFLHLYFFLCFSSLFALHVLPHREAHYVQLNTAGRRTAQKATASYSTRVENKGHHTAEKTEVIIGKELLRGGVKMIKALHCSHCQAPYSTVCPIMVPFLVQDNFQAAFCPKRYHQSAIHSLF